MPRTITCPNCRGPVKPDPERPTLACKYCQHHFENPVYQRPEGQGQESTRATPLVLGALIVGLIVIIVVVVLQNSSTRRKGTRLTVKTGPLKVQRITTGPGPAPRPRSRDAALPPERALEAKLAVYIKVVDETYERVERSRRRYRSWQKGKLGGPTCKERYVSYGLYSLGSYYVKSGRRGAGQAEKMPPSLPALHKAAGAYVEALAWLDPVLAEASSYYDRKGYAVDDCARGKALHPKLLIGFEAVARARAALRRELDVKVKGTLQRCLDRTRDNPKKRAAHLWARVIKAAGDMVIALRGQHQHSRPNKKQIKAAILKLEQAVAPLQALDAEAKRSSGYDRSQSAVGDLVTAAVAFLKTGGGRRFTFHDRLQLGRGARKHGIKGTFQYVLMRYNRLLPLMVHLEECGPLPQCDDDQCPEPR